MKKPLLLTLFLAAAASVSSHAATVNVLPFYDTFDSLASESNYSTDGAIWWVGNNGTYDNIILNSPSTPSTASVNAPGLARSTNGPGFIMSTTFSINSLGGVTQAGTIGFGALGTTSSFNAGSGTNRLVLADVSVETGGLRFVTLGASNSNFATGTWGSALLNDVSYTLTLTGVYLTAGGVRMTLSLSDGDKTTSVSQTFTAAQTPAGSNFGFRNRTNNGSLDVSYDDFYLGVIPEPSAAALALIGLPLAFARRRRA